METLMMVTSNSIILRMSKTSNRNKANSCTRKTGIQVEIFSHCMCPMAVEQRPSLHEATVDILIDWNKNQEEEKHRGALIE